MAKIKLKSGYEVLVDDSDMDSVQKYRWSIVKGPRTQYVRITIDGKRVLMHRWLLEVEEHQQVDHINGNGLDNRRSNLRICTSSENNRNTRVRLDNKSGYKGVIWHEGRHKWMAYIRVNKKQIYLGYFYSKHLAAEVYNEAAKKYFREYAKLNEVTCQLQ